MQPQAVEALAVEAAPARRLEEERRQAEYVGLLAGE
jgi:hypothetical protein